MPGQYARAVTPEQLQDVVRTAVGGAVDRGALAVEVPAEVVIERPKNPEHGDYATNVALRLAKPAGRPPREVAELLAEELRAQPGIARSTSPAPASSTSPSRRAPSGRSRSRRSPPAPAYGRTDVLAGQKLNLEFVSANPTGPVHIGGTRWAAVGDALGRLLEASGADVTREYYFNDAGAQIDRFARSLQAAAHGQPVPEDGYAGDYIEDIAAQVVAAEPGLLDRPEDEQLAVFRGARRRADGGRDPQLPDGFGVDFDVFFSERTCTRPAPWRRRSPGCASRGTSSSADGAVWLRTTDFGDDKDRVLVKADGEPTYFAADCAYYLDKRARGFDKVVIMLGADHSGYVGRYKALVAAAGDDPASHLEILIGQLVNLLRNGEPVRMSKRAGTVVNLDRPGRRRRRRRRPVRARPRLGRPADRHRRRPLEPEDQRQPGLLRPVRARPHLLACCATPPTSACPSARPRTSTSPAGPPAGDRPAAGDRGVPAGAHRRRRAAGPAPGGPLPGGAGRHLPPLLRLVPRAAARRRGGRPR